MPTIRPTGISSLRNPRLVLVQDVSRMLTSFQDNHAPILDVADLGLSSICRAPVVGSKISSVGIL